MPHAKHFLSIFFCLFSVNAYANESTAKATEQSSSMHTTNTKNTVEIHTLERKPWEDWRLTKEDWTRYLNIMKGPQGIWTPNIDPAVALGLHARNEQERYRFAKTQVLIEEQRANAALEFSRAYLRAWDEIAPTTNYLDVNKLPTTKRTFLQNNTTVDTTAKLTDGDVVVAFVTSENVADDGFITTLKPLVASNIIANHSIKFEIYFVGLNHNQQQGFLAKLLSFTNDPFSLFKNKRIAAIDGDAGLMSQIASQTNKPVSAIYLRKAGNEYHEY